MILIDAARSSTQIAICTHTQNGMEKNGRHSPHSFICSLDTRDCRDCFCSADFSRLRLEYTTLRASIALTSCFTPGRRRDMVSSQQFHCVLSDWTDNLPNLLHDTTCSKRLTRGLRQTVSGATRSFSFSESANLLFHPLREQDRTCPASPGP